MRFLTPTFRLVRPRILGHQAGRLVLWRLVPSLGKVCSLLLVLLLVTPQTFGQVKVVEDEAQRITTFQMTVSPAAEPEPAFRFRLLKHEVDRKEGNAAPFYYRAEMELDRVFKTVRDTYGEEFDIWSDMELPLAELPQEKVREAISSFDGIIFASLTEATSRRYCDWGWELEDLNGPEVFSFLLPEMQQARQLSRMLALQTRFALVEDRHEDALRFTQMNYQIGRDITTEPLLVNGLVGIAISGIANSHVLELMAAPGSPNLYWAISELPDPMIDLHSAIRFELGMALRMFPVLKDPESRSMTSGQWALEVGNAYSTMFEALGQGSARSSGRELGVHISPEVLARLRGCGMGLFGYTTAKKALIESGMTAKEIEAMPAGQVIAIQASRAYRHTAQEFEKLWHMPFPAAQRRQITIEKQLRSEGYLGHVLQSKEIIPIASSLLPAVQACRSAQERLLRDMAAMQVIEALRMHAAEVGELPKSLDDVKIVPVPLNPATGRPFTYKFDRETGVLDLPSSEGFPSYHRRFEITLRK